MKRDIIVVVSGNSKRLHPQSDGDLYYGDCVRLVKDK